MENFIFNEVPVQLYLNTPKLTSPVWWEFSATKDSKASFIQSFIVLLKLKVSLYLH